MSSIFHPLDSPLDPLTLSPLTPIAWESESGWTLVPRSSDGGDDDDNNKNPTAENGYGNDETTRRSLWSTLRKMTMIRRKVTSNRGLDAVRVLLDDELEQSGRLLARRGRERKPIPMELMRADDDQAPPFHPDHPTISTEAEGTIKTRTPARREKHFDTSSTGTCSPSTMAATASPWFFSSSYTQSVIQSPPSLRPLPPRSSCHLLISSVPPPPLSESTSPRHLELQRYPVSTPSLLPTTRKCRMSQVSHTSDPARDEERFDSSPSIHPPSSFSTPRSSVMTTTYLTPVDYRRLANHTLDPWSTPASFLSPRPADTPADTTLDRSVVVHRDRLSADENDEQSLVVDVEEVGQASFETPGWLLARLASWQAHGPGTEVW
ncbi:hypothetical protein M231_05624 [Tremella mesenterica]|uniref:Uncharacterized protein n=1 Tax=Tremella mesenterica TaxID=5217 RepID=A0A4Q1BHL8_TREME|nr:hypothetical protein M231_05624 [Tremella mesenterica]